ncbi:hypothetical protein RJ641_022181 [Dillenia turbinata]|uniref:Uncharacterized protein n=1 Tax=Dillenia turbinata TaxID=194707 RepID=A0AAN8UBV6_9MAGN
MAFSAALHSNLSTTSSHLPSKAKFFPSRINNKQKTVLAIALRSPKTNGQSPLVVKSVLGNRKTGINDNGATEPARVLLERLFAQTQKLEEQISKDSRLPQDDQLGFSLENLESDLEAALAVLKKKEEDLRDAERIVLLEHTDLNQAREELERREKAIAVALSRQETLEEELRQNNLKLVSQARHIDDLKLQLKEKDQEIAASQFSLSTKEEEIVQMRNDMLKNIEEATKVNNELEFKAQLLTEANEVIKKQETEIQELQKAIFEKDQELEESLRMHRVEEEKFKIAEANLEKQTMEWLVAKEELRKLAEESSKHMGKTNETMEDFKRVKQLLADVRYELVSSQKSLASSREKMQDQEKILEKQLAELEELKTLVMSYIKGLKEAQIEVENERVKLADAEAKNKELEWELSMKKKLVEDLQEELEKERYSLHQSAEQLSLLQEELDRKSSEFEEAHNLLQTKESELVEAKLEIQHLKSEQASLQQNLEEKDLELLNERKKLDEMNQEISELKVLMNSREDQLVQATSMLKEKEEHVQMMQHELNDTKLKYSDAEAVVERIVELTNKLVVTTRDDSPIIGMPMSSIGNNLVEHLMEKPANDYMGQEKQLETELKLTKDSLRTREMEVLAAQRALALKGEELKSVLERLEAKEKELQSLKEEVVEDAKDLRKLYALAQERIGEKSVGDLAIEKLQLEAAQLEVEAATSALYKITDMTRELLHKTSLVNEAEFGSSILLGCDLDPRTSHVDNNEWFTEVTAEAARLSSLIERLVKEAGIQGVSDSHNGEM